MKSANQVSCKPAELEGCHPGHDGRDVSLHNLAWALYDRSQIEWKADNVDEAITLHRAALELRPSGHSERSSSLHGLALCLKSSYNKQGLVVDLQEAVTFARVALEFCPRGDDNRGPYLYSLAECLLRGFVNQAMMYDLDEAIELQRVVLELRAPGHPERTRSSVHQVVMIVICVSTISLVTSGIGLRNEHPRRFSSLHGLAICLLDRYDNQGLVADLEGAVVLGNEGVELCPQGHPDRAKCIYPLSCGLWATFQRHPPMPGPGRPRSVRHPTSNADAAFTFHDLSQHLWDKFQKQPVIADLDEAICLFTYALELQLPEHCNYAASLKNLAVLIGERVQGLTPSSELNESVMLRRTVNNLYALGSNLKARFQNQRTIADLNEAITLYKYVLQLRPAGHASHPTNLHDHAICLIERFHVTTVVDDLEEAISLEQEALELSVPGDPSYDASKDSPCNLPSNGDQPAGFTDFPDSADFSGFTNIAGFAGFLHLAGCTEYEVVDQVIRHVIFETLETTPARLPHMRITQHPVRRGCAE
ncbi:hypothetical protein EDC04DRAFT_2958771 [Pisolithus marmoratus]|nr:hypothetical protein EDC04DRAFT_2958771 [Pisolithus marmoratus]